MFPDPNETENALTFHMMQLNTNMHMDSRNQNPIECNHETRCAEEIRSISCIFPLFSITKGPASINKLQQHCQAP